ncbi:single-stranded DNA-binding protein [Consotaella aegiceratis]|uniref:single-stranded DNA-binding protein n=1 Tax=Consotaella aegiceratis TaxID=3097961 RepID=UPI002F3FB70C
MRGLAEFQIIGRVGRIKTVGSTLRVSIVAEYGRTNDRGEFEANPYWNEVTFFNERRIHYIEQKVATGDIVHVRGTVRQTQYERDGETIYSMTLAGDDFDLLAKKAGD